MGICVVYLCAVWPHNSLQAIFLSVYVLVSMPDNVNSTYLSTIVIPVYIIF